MNGPSLLVGLILGIAGGSLIVVQGDWAPDSQDRYCSVFFQNHHGNCEPAPEAFIEFSRDHHDDPVPSTDVLEDAFNALVVLQRDYFDTDWGTWPDAIDWTAAVAGTIVTGMLTTLTKFLGAVDLEGVNDEKRVENLISSYYAQIISWYFGQDILAIRGEAFDDILWVVLGWIEALRFISIHNELHFPARRTSVSQPSTDDLKHIMESMPWYGHSWTPQFAHRSRVFWQLAADGWGDELCHGGMVWDPRLSPYKNAITNELWISASISMYQYFPGDNFMSPWSVDDGFPGRDPAHLAAAVEAYKWLKGVNMTNSHGLFVDGYHIDSSKPGNKECDVRNEMIYSYNQGVILTGQRGLWTTTGSPSFLEEGHVLIQSVIKATGWDMARNMPLEDSKRFRPGQLLPWHGLGRGGVMEERCDASGTCSQDGQTFKGIFFHHFATFCEEIEPLDATRGHMIDRAIYQRVRRAHNEACKSYLGWVRHNALAALETRDDKGRFGMWWGAGLSNHVLATPEQDGINHSAVNTTDYRNFGTPGDGKWGGGSSQAHWTASDHKGSNREQQILGGTDRARSMWRSKRRTEAGRADEMVSDDPNARGRGRSLETQIGGLALLRAYWQMSLPLTAEMEMN